MKLSLEDLRCLAQKRLTIDFNEPMPGSLAIKPAIGELKVSVNASGACIEGWIQTILKLDCHTCLRPFFQALNLTIDEHFVYEDYLSDEGNDLKERELLKNDFVEVIPYVGTIDISDVVYQAVTLATPTYCFCGPDCPGSPGLESGKGAGSSFTEGKGDVKSQGITMVDPRWKNLKTLFSKDDS